MGMKFRVSANAGSCLGYGQGMATYHAGGVLIYVFNFRECSKSSLTHCFPAFCPRDNLIFSSKSAL